MNTFGVLCLITLNAFVYVREPRFNIHVKLYFILSVNVDYDWMNKNR